MDVSESTKHSAELGPDVGYFSEIARSTRLSTRKGFSRSARVKSSEDEHLLDVEPGHRIRATPRYVLAESCATRIQSRSRRRWLRGMNQVEQEGTITSEDELVFLDVRS